MPDPIDRLRAVLAAASPGPWRRFGADDDVRVCRLPEDEAAMCIACVALAGETIDGDEWTPETLARWRADALAIAVLGSLRSELLAVAEAGRSGHRVRWSHHVGIRPEPCGCAGCEMARALAALDAAIERALPEVQP